MQFKPVFAPRRYCKYSETKPGTVLATGVYEKTFEGTFGLCHMIREADGTEVVLNKSGHLDFLLGRAGIGATVQVIYTGEGVVEKGKFKGKKSHQFNVMVANASPAESLPTD